MDEKALSPLDLAAAKLESIVADAHRKPAVVEVTQWQQVAA